MARAIADVAERARTKQLLPDDVQGGTFTITNPGSYGTFIGTPVISQPQSGILGTYAVVKRPWVIQDDAGHDAIAIRPMMNLTPDLRPPPRRRRLRRRLPARPPRPARGLERGRRVSDELVRLTVVASEQDAALLCGYLEAQGIEASYDNRGRRSRSAASARRLGRHEILVRAGDVEAAQAALEGLPT